MSDLEEIGASNILDSVLDAIEDTRDLITEAIDVAHDLVDYIPCFVGMLCVTIRGMCLIHHVWLVSACLLREIEVIQVGNFKIDMEGFFAWSWSWHWSESRFDIFRP